MSSVSITKLYDLLTVKVGKESAEDIISYIEEKTRIESNNISTRMSTVFVTKEDLANAKTETIKWLFAFWVGQTATTLGIFIHFLKR
jgi:hypothetical protein